MHKRQDINFSASAQVAQTSRYLYVVLSAGTTPFFPPASTTMLHNVIRSSIYPTRANCQTCIIKTKDNTEIEATLRVT